MASVQSLIVNFLDAARLLQLATAGSDGPWCTTLYFAADNLHYLYWLSPVEARHSRHIAANGRAAAAVVLPQQYGQPQQGLQIEGRARLVELQETAGLFQAYAERFTEHARLQTILSGNDSMRLYQLRPARIILYDEQFFPAQPRQEWQLDGQAVTVEDSLPEQESLLSDEDIPPLPPPPPPAPPKPEGPQVPLVIPPDHPRSIL